MRKIAQAGTRSSVATAVEDTPSSSVVTEAEDMQNGMGAVVTMRSVNIAGMRAARSARRSGMSVRAGMNVTLARISGMSAAMTVTPAAMSAMRAVTSETPNAGATRVSIKRGNEKKRANTKPKSERKRTSVAPGSERKRASVTVMADASSIPIGNVIAHATITVTTVIASTACDMSVGRS